jgi:hypothetical protein
MWQSSNFPFRSQARGAGFCIFAAAVAAGCGSQPPAYTWSHPASGEYLFAFDLRECTDQARDALARSGSPARQPTSQSPPLFACMTERGYFLVDPATGLALADRAPQPVGGTPQASRNTGHPSF